MAPIYLNHPTLLRVAAEACRDPRSVLQVIKGKGERSRDAVLAAARRLSLPSNDPVAVALLGSQK